MLYGMDDLSPTYTWRMLPVIRVVMYLAAVMVLGVALITLFTALHVHSVTSRVSADGSTTGSFLASLFFLAVAVGLGYASWKVRIVLTPDTVIVVNLFRTTRLPLCDVTKVEIGIATGDLLISYQKDGQQRTVSAMAEQSVLKGTMFKTGTGRLRSMIETINSRLPATAGETSHA
jgi:hypothetical protein